MQQTTFGQRLKAAFGNAKYADIAEKMGVSEATVKVYMAGRVPDAEKLTHVARLTKCNLHWLLTGEGSHFITAEPEQSKAQTKLAEIAKEQAPVAFASAEIAGPNVEAKTLELLTEYMLATGMVEHKLISRIEDVISAADIKRIGRMGLRRRTIDEMLRQIVRDEAARSENVGGEVSPMKPLNASDVMFAVDLGKVDGGEEIKKDVEAPKLRKTG